MLIKEAGEITKLTKKAIEYYTEQGLISPDILENGYRDFSQDDIERLKKIAVLRKLGLGTEDIRIALSDEKGQVLQKLSMQKELRLEREKAKQLLLDNLSTGKSWDEISKELKAIEQSETITEKLLDAFPGYYGRFLSLHYSRFLNEQITTVEQKEVYEQIIGFLDNAPALKFPNEIQEYLDENTKKLSTQNIAKINDGTKQSIENPDDFLSKNKELINWYLDYKKTDEYKNSPACKIEALLKEFNNSSGYYNVFIPAMKKLSKSYADYQKQLERANEKLYALYPEMKDVFQIHDK